MEWQTPSISVKSSPPTTGLQLYRKSFVCPVHLLAQKSRMLWVGRDL